MKKYTLANESFHLIKEGIEARLGHELTPNIPVLIKNKDDEDVYHVLIDEVIYYWPAQS